jgi:predicted transposase YbfD/YdcC
VARLRTLILATSCVTRGEEQAWETRTFMSGLGVRAGSLGDAIRRHRGIENGRHWVLDVSSREDAARPQDRNGSANLGAVRRLIVSPLRQEKTLKRGAKAKRMACALDPQYLLKVFATNGT